MSKAIVQSTGINALGTGPSVLGESQVKIPVGGKIRAGIKVLTAAAAKHPKAKGIYDAGMKTGKTFGEIEKELFAQCGFDRSPLTPRNVPYFTVRRQDFIMPEIADAIMEKYGTDGPDGFHLYRFPVIFPIDNWQAVMPHALRVYTRSELVYWSKYSPDGRRFCMTHAPIPVDPKSKRAARPYGGRPVVPRAENDGICDPSKCPEYQSQQCNLTGAFLFFVPSIPGSSAISLPTRSFYSMQQARQNLELVQFLTGGRISGTFDGKPLFYITKKQEEVSMIDPATGKAKRVKQWLIVVEADIDMTRVFQQGEQRTALAAGASAAAALEAPAIDQDETGEDEAPATDGPQPAGDPPPPSSPPPEPPADDPEEVKAWRRKVFDGVSVLKIKPDVFARYGIRTWGEGWSGKVESLKKAHEILNHIADNADTDAIKEIEAIGGAE